MGEKRELRSSQNDLETIKQDFASIILKNLCFFLEKAFLFAFLEGAESDFSQVFAPSTILHHVLRRHTYC